MKKLCILLILSTSILLVSGDLRSQDIKTNVRIADSLFSHQEFEQSIRLYKRVIFFDEQGTFDSITFNKVGLGYFYLENYLEATKYFQYAYNYTGDHQLYLNMVLCQLLDGNYKAAKLSLYNIPESSSDLYQRKLLLLCLAEFQLKNFDSAKALFLESQTDESQILASYLFDDAKKVMKKYKKSKVKLMSLLLPGLGQTFSGDLKEGLNSFGITAIFGALYFRVSNTLGIIDALITIMPWYQRYYIGGYNKAGLIAERKKQIELNKIYNKIISVSKKSF